MLIQLLIILVANFINLASTQQNVTVAMIFTSSTLNCNFMANANTVTYGEINENGLPMPYIIC